MLRNVLGGLFLVIAVGCGNGVGSDGAEVGGDCIVSSDCTTQSRCLTGSAWPSGYCAWACEAAADCPDGSTCVDSEGGVCVVTCGGAAECRGDDGYDCVAYEARGAGGTVMGCGAAAP